MTGAVEGISDGEIPVERSSNLKVIKSRKKHVRTSSTTFAGNSSNSNNHDNIAPSSSASTTVSVLSPVASTSTPATGDACAPVFQERPTRPQPPTPITNLERLQPILPSYSSESSNPVSYQSALTPSQTHPQQIFQPRLFMPYQKSRRFARIFLFLLFITTILFFFLSFDCWPTLSSLFDIRRSSSGDNSCGRTCYFRNRNLKPFPVASIHSQAHHSNSLLARPLKHLSNSFSLARLSPERVEALLNKENQKSKNSTTSNECENRTFWRAHQRESAENRVSRLRSLCNLYDFDGKIFTYRTKSSNRQKTNNSTNIGTCSTHTCPLLINTHERILACFVQKTASTSLKTLFLKLDKNAQNLSVESADNLTMFHNRANDELHRISPVSLLGNSLTSTYTKALFVRHPFVRLVSAFKDKAETGPDVEPFFWTQYWNPLLDKIHGKKRDPTLRLTFEEFVDNYLLQTDPYIWDEHWAPIWTRCEPCFVRYNLIGKLESSERDFRLLNNILLQSTNNHSHKSEPETEVWKNRNNNFGQTSSAVSPCNRLASKYRETRKYLLQLTPNSIIELYKKFYLDFELFGYTLEELFT